MISRNTLLALALLGGCKEDGRSDTVRLYYYPGLEQHPQETIDDAAEILGLELVLSDTPRRAVVVFFTDGLPPFGESASMDECGRNLWVFDDPQALAHEIGHTLYLDHVEDEQNLMYPGLAPDRTDLTDEQIDTMRWAAWTLENNCPS